MLKSFVVPVLASVAAISSLSSKADTRLPYKIQKISCQGDGQSLELVWDYSKALFVHEILVNGKNEIGGSRMQGEDNGATTYSKDGVFYVQLGDDDYSRPFKKDVVLLNRNYEMLCVHSIQWKWNPLAN